MIFSNLNATDADLFAYDASILTVRTRLSAAQPWQKSLEYTLLLLSLLFSLSCIHWAASCLFVVILLHFFFLLFTSSLLLSSSSFLWLLGPVPRLLLPWHTLQKPLSYSAGGGVAHLVLVKPFSSASSLQAEALHIWRMCANNDINLMHLDDSYASICRLFDCPTSSASPHQHACTNSEGHVVTTEGSGAHESHVRSPGLSKAEQLLQKVQMHGSCQAYLLLSSLVRHAIR